MILRNIKSNKGMTLIELVVAMALTVIILAASTAFVVPVFRLYISSTNESAAIKAGSIIESKLKLALSSSIEMYLSLDNYLEGSGEEGYGYIYISEGRIVSYQYGNEAEGLIREVDYLDFQAEVYFVPRKKLNEDKYSILEANVSLTKDDILYERKVIINLSNMDMEESSGIGQLGGGFLQDNTPYYTIKYKTIN